MISLLPETEHSVSNIASTSNRSEILFLQNGSIFVDLEDQRRPLNECAYKQLAVEPEILDSSLRFCPLSFIELGPVAAEVLERNAVARLYILLHQLFLMLENGLAQFVSYISSGQLFRIDGPFKSVEEAQRRRHSSSNQHTPLAFEQPVKFVLNFRRRERSQLRQPI
jgi:hypothetical protein